MATCIILHNMIVEDQRTAPAHMTEDEYDKPSRDRRRRRRQHRQSQTDFCLQSTLPADISSGTFSSLVRKMKDIRDAVLYFQLQSDLIADIWKSQSILD